jgi:hypothetical protein
MHVGSVIGPCRARDFRVHRVEGQGLQDDRLADRRVAQIDEDVEPFG